MKRWLERILISLALGVVTTVAVAWGTTAIRKTNFTQIDSTVGAVAQLTSGWPELGSYRAVWDLGSFDHAFVVFEEENMWWRRYGVAVYPGEEDTQFAMIFYYSSGWPIRCFEGIRVSPSETSVFPSKTIDRGLSSFGFGVRTPARSPGPVEYLVPYHIRWNGLITNIIAYGILFFMTTISFRALRRVRRTRRGRCPMCAYDLRGDLDAGCSECGWGRAKDGQ